MKSLLRRVRGALAVMAWGLAVARAAPVINEIHYDPPEKTEPAEFIELFNPDDAEIDLGGWRITDAVEFVFPPGAKLAARGYAVVAQDPEFIRARWGVDAVGPWTGRLANRDDVIELRDSSGAIVDRVDYRLGFPWPTVGEPPGLSIELLHPALDNELGGNWRASAADRGSGETRSTLVEAASEWRFHPGRSVPSSPFTAWREPAFDDSTWRQGVLPIGYDPGLPLGTELDDMRGQYTSVYLRRRFEAADPAEVSALEIHALYDDGFRVWLNGRLLLSVNVADGELAHNSTASAALESEQYEAFVVPLPAGWLAHENVVAVHALNASLNSSTDFYFDARILGVKGPIGLGPTPGRLNIVTTTNAPPAVRQVNHEPLQPVTGDTVRITARITDPDGVQSVQLEWQVVEPGDYIAITDPRFATEWNAAPMHDDGGGGDAIAGDSVFTALLPPDVQVHRRLVRYRITAGDTHGAKVRVPYADDPQPNFAYFVYDGVPEWRGSVRPGIDPEFTVSREEMNRLPVIHLLSTRESVEDATWFSRYGGEAYPWNGTLVFNGRVYDHIRYRARGGVWRYAMTKNMWKFDFNRGHDFIAQDDWGREFEHGWTKLNLGASIQQGEYNHRGEQGMFESTGFRIFRLAGVPAMHSAFAQFRIIDEAAETSPEDPYTGDFWGLYLMLEQPNGRFLDQHGLPDGNLYKMEGGGGEANNIGPAGPADGSDLREFLTEYNDATEEWWRRNFEIENYLSYQTVVQAIHHYDICHDKNFFYYHNPETDRWQVIPWDLDLTWAENMYDAGCGGVDRIRERLLPGPWRHPSVWRAWQNRIREFRDLFWNTDEAWRLIDEQASLLRGPGAGPTILDADRAQWDFNPRMDDPRYSTAPSSKAGTGRFYRWSNYPAAEVSRDFNGAIQVMKRYVVFRASNPGANPRPLDDLAEDPDIPETPAIAYAGPEGFPVNGLRFTCSGYSGAAPFAAVRWRIGEITRTNAPAGAAREPWKYEIVPVWESGPIPAPVREILVPPGALRVGSVYRARVQFQDAEGRTSHWSDPVEFVAGPASGAQGIAESLRVTEIMYNSADGAEFDFLEIHNAGAEPLDLAGVEISDGIRFIFPPGSTIAPSAYALVVRADPLNDFAAFRALYGLSADVPIFGPYDGNLADGGERIVLSSPGDDEDLISVEYSDGRGWPQAADGAGHSLVPVHPDRADAPLDYGGAWRASAFRRGSPGAQDPSPDTRVVLNEIVSTTGSGDDGETDAGDWIEIHLRADEPFEFGPGWHLSDDDRNLWKWEIPPGTTLPPRGFVVFDEATGFNNPPGSGFGISRSGETVYLSQRLADGRERVVDAVRLEAQENGRAAARVPDGGDHWDYVTPRSRAARNPVAPARVYVSEVLYHAPAELAEGMEEWMEFVELHNGTGASIALFSTNGAWRLEGGVDYTFPTGVTLAADERILLVPFDPQFRESLATEFRDRLRVPESTRLFGPFSGRLDNASDRFSLQRPVAPDLPGTPVPWAVVDEVHYADRGAWPAAADGAGSSLQRINGRAPGTDPAQWFAAPPTPGTGTVPSETDQDQDGLPDAWEFAHGLNPSDPSDATQDPDGDGLSNLQEFLAGTHPRDAESVLRIHSVRGLESGELEIAFTAMPGVGYRVESNVYPEGGAWGVVKSIEPRLVAETVRVAVRISESSGFYRIRVADQE